MKEELIKKDAKQVVDLLFDTKVFKEDLDLELKISNKVSSAKSCLLKFSLLSFSL